MIDMDQENRNPMSNGTSDDDINGGANSGVNSNKDENMERYTDTSDHAVQEQYVNNNNMTQPEQNSQNGQTGKQTRR